MSRKIIALLLAAFMIMSVLCLAGCGNNAAEPTANDGEGTEENPWLVGAENAEDVKVYIVDGSMWVDGTGAMKDFEDPADRPWNDVIADAEQVSVFGEISRIGKNAFYGAGTNCHYFDAGFFSEGLTEIGESAFEGCNFNGLCILTIPETVESIGARAFADSGISEVYFDGVPAIAEDAFAGTEATFYVRSGYEWNAENMLPYGGETGYKWLYAFDYTCDYGTEDMSADGTMYVPEGEVYEYDAEAYLGDEGYHFVRYEVVEGDYEIAEPENPVLNIELTGNVVVKIIFAAD